jgi:antitoxin MazE
MEAKPTRFGDDFASDDFVIRSHTVIGTKHGVTDGQPVEVKRRVPSIRLAEMVAEAKRLGPRHEPETVNLGPGRGSKIISDNDPHWGSPPHQ